LLLLCIVIVLLLGIAGAWYKVVANESGDCGGVYSVFRLFDGGVEEMKTGLWWFGGPLNEI